LNHLPSTVVLVEPARNGEPEGKSVAVPLPLFFLSDPFPYARTPVAITVDLPSVSPLFFSSFSSLRFQWLASTDGGEHLGRCISFEGFFFFSVFSSRWTAR